MYNDYYICNKKKERENLLICSYITIKTFYFNFNFIKIIDKVLLYIILTVFLIILIICLYNIQGKILSGVNSVAK